MANYTKITNFANKDSLITGDVNKRVRGTEIDAELAAISTAITTKQDVSVQLTGAVLQALHPIGSVYINATNAANPATYFGFGTWSAFGAGRVPVGFNAGDPLFDTAEETGGSKDATLPSHTHTATVTDPGHLHGNVPNGPSGCWGAGGCQSFNRGVTDTLTTTSTAVTGITVSNSTAGTDGTNANLQPYITVFMWKRVS